MSLKKRVYEIYDFSSQKNIEKTYRNILQFYNDEYNTINLQFARDQRRILEEIYQVYLLDKNLEPFICFINSIIYSDLKVKEKRIPLIDFTKYDITLEELYTNNISIKKKCGRCHSLGFRKVETCGKCNGAKRITFIIFNEYNMVTRHIECDECEGYGKIGYGESCIDCDGRRFHTHKINICPPKNFDRTFKYSFRLGDDQEFEYFFKIQPHPLFQKEGKDLIYHHSIPLSSLIYGFSFNLKLLDGNIIIIQNQEGKVYNPQTTYIIPGFGFTDETGQGDLHIHFEVIYPDTLVQFQKSVHEIKNENENEQIFFL